MNSTVQNPTLDQLRNKAAGTISDVKNDVSSAANEIRGTASTMTSNVKSDIQQLMDSAKTSGKAELAAAAERLSSYMSTIAESATAMQQKGREKVQQVAESTDTYVHDKPWQSVAIGAGIGAAIGFALGCLATRR
jgi:ElaB/YqjD/DUF883 family membrane-anchored ribosome-binding protein